MHIQKHSHARKSYPAHSVYYIEILNIATGLDNNLASYRVILYMVILIMSYFLGVNEM